MKQKLVQIDRKTWIEVDEDIPDEVAVAKFKENIARKPNLKYWSNRKKS